MSDRQNVVIKRPVYMAEEIAEKCGITLDDILLSGGNHKLNLFAVIPEDTEFTVSFECGKNEPSCKIPDVDITIKRGEGFLVPEYSLVDCWNEKAVTGDLPPVEINGNSLSTYGGWHAHLIDGYLNYDARGVADQLDDLWFNKGVPVNCYFRAVAGFRARPEGLFVFREDPSLSGWLEENQLQDRFPIAISSVDSLTRKQRPNTEFKYLGTLVERVEVASEAFPRWRQQQKGKVRHEHEIKEWLEGMGFTGREEIMIAKRALADRYPADFQRNAR